MTHFNEVSNRVCTLLSRGQVDDAVDSLFNSNLDADERLAALEVTHQLSPSREQTLLGALIVERDYNAILTICLASPHNAMKLLAGKDALIAAMTAPEAKHAQANRAMLGQIAQMAGVDPKEAWQKVAKPAYGAGATITPSCRGRITPDAPRA